MAEKKRLDVSPGSPLGVAFDIGSTTLAGALVDLNNEKVLSTVSAPNPQASEGGADILSRIRAIEEEPEFLVRLQSRTITILNEIIEGLVPQRRGTITELSGAGNSVMEHILLRVSPKPLGKVPYRPVFKEARSTSATELGLTHSALAKDALLYTFPLIGGFIGGDTVAMMLSLGLGDGANRGNELAIDIGTNSEIVLSTPDKIYAASAAAGPAFEGGEIEFGMPAGPGAIRSIEVTSDDITLDVIEGGAPKGICGSALIDIVSKFIRAGVIDPTGRILDAGEIETNLSTRIISAEEKEGAGGNSFLLYMGPDRRLTLSQNDVRSLQTAKGSIRAGINVLMHKAGLKNTDIDKVHLAGAFGANLSKEGLETIGLLDVCWHDNIHIIGDAALDGAVLTLGSIENRARAETLARETGYVSLSGSPGFEKEFIENMSF